MAMHPDRRHIPRPISSVVHWLLDSDPSIRWQALRDLADASEEDAAAERAKVATEGWGAALLARQNSAVAGRAATGRRLAR